MAASKHGRTSTSYDRIPQLKNESTYRMWLGGIEAFCLQYDLYSFLTGSAQKPLAPSIEGPGRSVTFQEYQRQITTYHRKRGKMMHLIYHTMTGSVRRHVGLQLDSLKQDIGPPKQIFDKLDDLYGGKEDFLVDSSAVKKFDETSEKAKKEIEHGDSGSDMPITFEPSSEASTVPAKRKAAGDVGYPPKRRLTSYIGAHLGSASLLTGSDRWLTLIASKAPDEHVKAATQEAAIHTTLLMATTPEIAGAHSSLRTKWTAEESDMADSKQKSFSRTVSRIATTHQIPSGHSTVPAKQSANVKENVADKQKLVSDTTSHSTMKPQTPEGDPTESAGRTANRAEKAASNQEQASRKSLVVARECLESLEGLLTGVLAERTAAVTTLLNVEAEGNIGEFFLELKTAFLILGGSGLEVSDEVLVPFVLAKLARKRRDLVDALKLDGSKPEEIYYEELVELCMAIDRRGNEATKKTEGVNGSNGENA